MNRCKQCGGAGKQHNIRLIFHGYSYVKCINCKRATKLYRCGTLSDAKELSEYDWNKGYTYDKKGRHLKI